ncbi:sigma factor-like helix-turn-helix DNA-binding protein [Streptomyces sp. NPDC014864]|uniref:sigma factor-like helix-turn-helix DNA-binding protein n=1 Tax=Streptomyces sp. NPDC014864 TaxID=3364924 RepID=UPI003701B249
MRSNSTGGPETQSRTSTGSTTEELPEAIQCDVDRVKDLVDTGFTGRLWQQTADELFGYAFRPLMVAMRHTHKLAALTAKSKTPLKMSDEERSALHRNSADREDLAVRTIYVALETFPELLKRGGYAPSAHRGKNGRPTKLTSFFYGRCGLVFPRVFYTWRDEREDRFERHARRMPDEMLARVLGLDGPELADAGVAQLCDTLTGMITKLKPRDRAVWLMTLDGLSRSEIADELGIKIGDVENARYAFRIKVKNRRKTGELHIPPEIELEWARAKAAEKNSRGAAR